MMQLSIFVIYPWKVLWFLMWGWVGWGGEEDTCLWSVVICFELRVMLCVQKMVHRFLTDFHLVVFHSSLSKHTNTHTKHNTGAACEPISLYMGNCSLVMLSMSFGRWVGFLLSPTGPDLLEQLSICALCENCCLVFWWGLCSLV